MKHFTLRQFPAVIGLLVLTLGLLLPVSCSREVFIDFEDDELVEMTITVGSNTRTTNDGNGTTWTEGDDLTVIHSATSASTPSFWPSQFLFYGGNAFHGTVSRLSATNNWYAVYPYAESNASANDIVFTLPSTQKQQGNASRSHLAGKSFPLFGKAEGVARSTELNLPMKNLLAVAKFNVTNNSGAAITIKEIEYTASSPIAGTFSVDLTGETPVFNNGSVKTVKLNVYEGTTIAAGATTQFYMAIAPYEAAAGTVRQVKVVATDGTPCYRTYNTAVTFKSGVIKNIDFDFDKNHQTPQIDEPGTAGEVELEIGEEPKDGVYLLVYDNGENSMAFAAFEDFKSAKYAIPVSVVDGLVYPKGDLGGRDLSDFAVNLENTGEDHPNDAGHKAYNVRNSEDKYVFYATAGGTYSAEDALHIMDINEMDVQGTTYKYYHSFVQAEDGVRIVCSIATGGNKYLLVYNNGFNYEQVPDNGSEDQIVGTKLHLFQVGETTPKVEQTLEFNQTTVTYNFDNEDEFLEPQLTGDYHTTVTYSSNNTSVATVDENGNVTIHAAGTATITATAPAGTVDGVEYKSATASYTITSTSTKNRVFYLTTELEANQEYLIVSNGKALTNNNGSIAATTVSPVNGEISIAESSSMVWASAQSGGGFSLANAGKYITTTSSSYNPSLSLGNTATEWNYNNSSNYLFYSQNSGYGTFDYYLYYSSSSWTLGNSWTGNPGTVALYSATRPATKQILNFVKSTDRWYVGEGGDHEIGRTYDILQLDGAYTEVTYTSSNPQVAEIVNNSQIKVNALGSTKITATATAGTVNGIEYKEGSASYTLYIKEPVTGDWTELEGSPFNLENADVKAYLDKAATSYTGSSISSSIVSDYAPGGKYSTITSKTTDYGQPVTIDWGTQSSGTATITILADDKETEVWTQTASSGSTSSEVYNLIPGETYYCTVEDNSGYLLKGVFETTGRRRMIKISEGTTQDYARNCRDLGGMVTADGTKRIKYGMIYRGTNLDETSDTEQSLMANYLNIGWDLDLRGRNEGKGEAFAKKYGVQYVHGEFSASVSSIMSSSKLKDVVLGFFEAAANGKASYFHCRIGSDRTGFWGLLIEGLLGVDVQECSKDYELTCFANNISGLGNRTRNASSMNLFSDGVSAFNRYDGSTLQDKIVSYLTSSSVGITLEQIEAFQNAVLEDL